MFFKSFFIDLLYDILGGLAYGIGIVCFFNSCNIAPGGISGISIMLNYLFDTPIGIVSLLLNMPILIAGYLRLDKSVMNKTLKSILVTTIIMDYIVTPFFPVYSSDRILAALFGGIILGFGLVLIFSRGSTTGGTDILSHIIRQKFPHFSIGRAMMMVDCVIILISTLVFKNIESGLYAIVGLFCSTKIIDSLLYGADRGTLILVISQKNREIGEKIIKNLGRGATLLDSHGMYSGVKNAVLLCAVRRHEFSRLKKIVTETDNDAFFMVCPADEIAGEGFSKK